MCATALLVSGRKTAPSSAGTADAHAKLNLTLAVLGLRGDGFHELRSLVIGLGLCDRVRVEDAGKPGIRFTCNMAALTGGDNLVVQAVGALAEAYEIEPVLAVHLQKSIPVGGGLGGGSSDAAAALALCNRHWQLDVGKTELATIGARLGSDVGLFFSLPAAVMSGRGERVKPIAMKWSGWALLIEINEMVSTAAVYSRLQPCEYSTPSPRTETRIAQATHADEIMALVSNDLRPAVFRVAPRVAAIRRELLDGGLGPIEVCGAGSTLFRLFDHQSEANRIADRINELTLGVSQTVTPAPVGGVLTTI